MKFRVDSNTESSNEVERVTIDATTEEKGWVSIGGNSTSQHNDAVEKEHTQLRKKWFRKSKMFQEKLKKQSSTDYNSLPQQPYETWVDQIRIKTKTKEAP